MIFRSQFQPVKKRRSLFFYLDLVGFLKALITGGVIWTFFLTYVTYASNELTNKEELIVQRNQEIGKLKQLQVQNQEQIIVLDKRYKAVLEKIKIEKRKLNPIDITLVNAKYLVAKMPKKAVALTFDDGPSSATTKILDILKKHNVKATFFVTGRSAKNGCEILKRIFKEGHEIANHTYSHAYLKGRSASFQKKQMETARTEIQKCLGNKYTSRWFRSPYGEQDRTTLKIAHQLGMSTALWTIDTNDWRGRTTVKAMIREVSRSKGQDIVLMHDTMDKTVFALEDIITNLDKNNLQFMTMSQAFPGE
ncbi:MAG: polysaccharide deacetylase family protein [Prochloraceae cyanobacterium]|nr:polysaccharide deacetylase family protein [Prochloraceae cyanobacterium]